MELLRHRPRLAVDLLRTALGVRCEGQTGRLRRGRTLRFGPLPERLERRRASADSSLRWAARLVSAGTADEVFGDSPLAATQ